MYVLLCLCAIKLKLYTLFALHITDLDPIFPVPPFASANVHERGSRYVLYESVYVSCAFALCPGCYVFWYVAKGRGQAESRAAGARSGGSCGLDEPQSQRPAILMRAGIKNSK